MTTLVQERPGVSQHTPIQRLQENEMQISSLATIYGCCGLFDLCGDSDLMSLSFEGQNAFLDWVGWELTSICKITKNFITWVRPEPYQGGRSVGYVGDACSPSNGVEWGTCDFTLFDFGLLRRHGPTRNATRNGVRLCEAQPRYRLDGTPIVSDAEYDMRITVEGLMQDLKLMLINGNDATPGMFDGFETLVKTGYTDSQGVSCSMMDSIIIDWNGNSMDGGAGETWNGAPLSANWNFVDVLLGAFRRILDRIKNSPALASQPLSVGDIVFVAPTNLIRCLLDSYTCWSVCEGRQYNEVALQTYEARTYRNNLNGGMFQAGRIWLDGFEIPLIAYDWGLLNGGTSADAYLLTGAIGNIKLIQGQMLDMRNVPGGYPEAGYSYTDGGRLLTWVEREKTCIFREVEMQPRLLSWAPWTNVRFQDVRCNQPGGIYSPDPWSGTSFFPESSFLAPECPPGGLRAEPLPT